MARASCACSEAVDSVAAAAGAHQTTAGRHTTAAARPVASLGRKRDNRPYNEATMGKVVKLEPGAKDRPAGGRGTRARAAGDGAASDRARRHKTALVLGGGGFTGGVYEIGALRALDLLSVNRTVNQFDVYVGTSAGAFVAAAVANGITPEEMMRVLVQQVPTSFPDARVSALLRPNYREFLSRGLLVPFRVAQLIRTLIRDLGQISAVDI